MRLHRLEIAGFKSFGSRVQLELGSGVSAIVGPNGSGKSNIAEAVRWALGSQNVRDLRARKSEELIYAGNELGKARASMAEVILTLKGRAHETELAVEELEISRRMYRSGETEYRLGGQIVRVKDLQRILAQAGFGTTSYTVIGQGMVDSLIIAQPAERKVLFEEASGIRAFELERVDVVRKLTKVGQQAESLKLEAAQLVPERAELARQVIQLERRDRVFEKLQTARSHWLQSELQAVVSDQDRLIKLSETAKHTIYLAKKCAKELQKSAQTMTQLDTKAATRQDNILSRLTKIDTLSSYLNGQIAQLEGKLQVALQQTDSDDKPAKLKRQLQVETTRLQQFQQYLDDQAVTNAKYETKIDGFNLKIAELNSQLTSLRQQLIANQRNAYLQQALSLAHTIQRFIQMPTLPDREPLQIALHKLVRMVKLASEADSSSLPSQIGKVQQQIARELSKREDIVEQQTTTIIKIRSVELDILAAEKNFTDMQARYTKAIRLQQPKTETASLQKNLQKSTSERDALLTESQALRAELAEPNTHTTTAEQISLAQETAQNTQRLLQAESTLTQAQKDIETARHHQASLTTQATTWSVKPDTSSTDQTVTREQLTRLEAELDIIGEIDTRLADSHSELNTRVNELESQAADLETASADLTKLLDELERRIRQTFETNFSQLNQAFSMHFKQLFSGGTAGLELVPDDDGGYGINITARPPGKRLEHLTSLSGGEKAMTAIALLAAILTVNPSPFVVLDEVDAPLDDANALAFTELLRLLSKQSQLIVITHNHETMLQADELFGVTSNPKTSSKIIAVDLRQAEKMAA